MATQVKRILRIEKVVDKTGVAKSSLYLMMSKKLFPQAIKLGARSVGWLESEVDEWISMRVKVTRDTKGE